MIVNRMAISDTASDVERLAVDTLQNYCQRMCGREIPLLSADSLEAESDGTVLVGLSATNPRIASLIRSRKIRNPERSLANGGFIIETLIDGGLSRLVITGRDSEGVLNGVHHLLEKIFGNVLLGDDEFLTTSVNLTVGELSIAKSPER
jgi:alpha-glucuronidase